MTPALARLEASRARLREAMRPVLPQPSAAQVGNGTHPWLQRLRELPVIGLVTEALGGWWAHNPLRPVAQVAAGASGAVVRPLAQRYPIALVLAAGAVGAALAWARPWRLVLRSALFAGLVPHLASRVVANLPIESWLTLLGAALSKTGAQPRPADTPPERNSSLPPNERGDL